MYLHTTVDGKWKIDCSNDVYLLNKLNQILAYKMQHQLLLNQKSWVEQQLNNRFFDTSLSAQLQNINLQLCQLIENVKIAESQMLQYKQERIDLNNPVSSADSDSNPVQNLGLVSPTANWQVANFNDPLNQWIVQPTGQLVTVDHNGQINFRFGSGFHIGEGYFLTAGHCYYNPGGIHDSGIASCRISFGYQENNPHGEILVSFTLAEVAPADQVVALDYAILKFENHINVPSLSINSAIEFDSMLGKDAVVVHHPAGDTKKVSRGIFSRFDDSFLSAHPNYIAYSANTLGGSSGAPVALNDLQQVVGVHIQGDGAQQTGHRAVSIKAIAQHSKVLNSCPTVVNSMTMFRPIKELPDIRSYIMRDGTIAKVCIKIINAKSGSFVEVSTMDDSRGFAEFYAALSGIASHVKTTNHGKTTTSILLDKDELENIYEVFTKNTNKPVYKPSP